MSKRFYRSSQAALLFVTIIVIFMSFYFEYALGLKPCPLCLMQRICAIILGMFVLMGMTLSTIHRGRLVAGFQVFFSVAGLYFAGRQLWLQSLPPEQAPACMPGLDIMMKYFPWHDIIQVLIWGAGDCSEPHWHWLGLSMAGWSALYFLGMFVASVLIMVSLGRTLTRY